MGHLVQSRSGGGEWQTWEEWPTYLLACERASTLGLTAPISLEWRVVAAPDGTLPTVPLDSGVARELSRAARSVNTWTTKRNELIRAAHSNGGGVREIARITGLSPASVHNILFGRKRRTFADGFEPDEELS